MEEMIYMVASFAAGFHCAKTLYKKEKKVEEKKVSLDYENKLFLINHMGSDLKFRMYETTEECLVFSKSDEGDKLVKELLEEEDMDKRFIIFDTKYLNLYNDHNFVQVEKFGDLLPVTYTSSKDYGREQVYCFLFDYLNQEVYPYNFPSGIIDYHKIIEK